MNPLDGAEVFSIELMNPNPTSSKTKDGPVYRVSFEMQKDDWQMFMDGNTKGMVLEMQGRVTQESKKPILKTAQEKVKGGPLSKEAAMWCQDELQDEYAELFGYSDFKQMIYAWCGIKSRAELDHNNMSAYQWNALKNNFITWSESEASSRQQLG